MLWALPTLRAAECVALDPTESAAKDGRCLYGKPRGEGEGLFQNGRRSGEVLSPLGVAYWGTTFFVQKTKIPTDFPSVRGSPIAMLRRDPDRKHISVLPRLSAFPTGRYHRCGCPGSPHGLQLLRMYIDAPESTKNFRSSGDF